MTAKEILRQRLEEAREDVNDAWADYIAALNRKRKAEEEILKASHGSTMLVQQMMAPRTDAECVAPDCKNRIPVGTGYCDAHKNGAACAICYKPLREGLRFCAGLSPCWRKGSGL